MNSKPVILLILILLFSFEISAQQELVIGNISFQGLKNNKADYLRKIISLELRDTFNVETIKSDIQNLKNISGIVNAYSLLDTIGSQINVVYLIEERTTVLPVIDFGGIKDNLWFRLGIIDNNWRGRGQVLLAYYQNNDSRHSAQLYFKNLRYKNGDWGHSFNLNKWSSVEPLFFKEGTVQYQYDINSIGASLIRNIGVRKNLEFGATYFVEKYEQSTQQILENPPGPKKLTQKKMLTKLIYNHNYLNYNFFYLKGYDLNITYQNVFNIFDNTFFNSILFQTRFFLNPIKNINIASRIRFGISTNNDSPFAPFVADSHFNIRGVGNRIDRGTAQVVFNTELRYTLIHIGSWASQIVAFSDLGTWRNPGGKFKELLDRSQFRHFVGLGFRVIYQKVFGATLRVDYGVDVYNTNERGIVIGLGQYF